MGVATAALSLLLRSVVSGSALLFAVYYLGVVATRRWRDDAYWAHFPPDFGCDDTVTLDACTKERALFLAFVPATAALAACLLAASAALAAAAPLLPLRLRLAAQRQIPWARAFWARWCGGLSRQDCLLASGVMLVNALWAAALGLRYRRLLRFFAGRGGGSDTPLWALEVMLASIALGQMLFPNLALLFFPVARGSPLLRAAGVSYPSAVRAHRWLGFWTMALASAHSLGFWGVWLARGNWLEEAFRQGSRVNNLAGGASFLAGLALWITSLEAARRARYSLFIAVHHLGWWAFFLAGAAHYSPIVWYFLPGLLLYFVDAAFRVWSWGSGSGSGGGGGKGGGVVALEVAWEEEEGEDWEGDEGAAVVAVVARAPGAFAAADTGFVWVRCPQVSLWQWHPFEYVLVGGGCDGAPGGGGGSGQQQQQQQQQQQLALALHIKAYGRWSRAFARLAREAAVTGRPGDLDLRLEAPYGDEPPSADADAADLPRLPSGADSDGGGDGEAAAAPVGGARSGGGGGAPIVVVAGGVGATAALSLLRELEREAEAERSEGDGGDSSRRSRRRRPLLLVWAARHAPELAVLLPRLLDAAGRACVALEARLFFTGRGGAAALAPGRWAVAAAAAADDDNDANDDGGDGSNILSSALRLAPPPANFASSQCPVLAPGRLGLQLAQRFSAHALGAAGALAALLLVRQLSVVAPALRGEDDGGWTTAQAGLASAVGIALGAFVPALAVVVATRLGLALVSPPSRGAAIGGGGGGGGSDKRGGALRRPLLVDAEACDGSSASPSSQRPLWQQQSRVSFVFPEAGADANAAVVAVVAPAAAAPDEEGKAGGGAAAAAPRVELPVSLGRPASLRAMVTDWLMDQAPQGGAAAELYAMGPEALVAEARAIVDDLARERGAGGRAAAAGGGAAGGTLPPVLFRLRTHEL